MILDYRLKCDNTQRITYNSGNPKGMLELHTVKAVLDAQPRRWNIKKDGILKSFEIWRRVDW